MLPTMDFSITIELPVQVFTIALQLIGAAIMLAPVWIIIYLKKQD